MTETSGAAEKMSVLAKELQLWRDFAEASSKKGAQVILTVVSRDTPTISVDMCTHCATNYAKSSIDATLKEMSDLGVPKATEAASQ